MDIVDANTRSRIMSRVRGKNTRPELMLRRAVHATGTRFRIHDRSILGTPDLSHKGAKVAVFVDGCFWHGCPEHYSRPQTREAFWDAKLAYNRDLRARVVGGLQTEGWQVIQIWECKVKSKAKSQAAIVVRAVNLRRTTKRLLTRARQN